MWGGEVLTDTVMGPLGFVLKLLINIFFFLLHMAIPGCISGPVS